MGVPHGAPESDRQQPLRGLSGRTPNRAGCQGNGGAVKLGTIGYARGRKELVVGINCHSRAWPGTLRFQWGARIFFLGD